MPYTKFTHLHSYPIIHTLSLSHTHTHTHTRTHTHTDDYELSVQASSSLAVSEAELESGTGGIDKKNLEPIPEADKDNGDSSIGLGKEEVIANPGTTGDGSQDSSEPEEITRM